ncbi:hypothetical protein ACHAQA_005032 [Verticillium albo-atrum]
MAYAIPSLSTRLALRAIGLFLVAYFVKGVVMLYQKRTAFRALAKKHGFQTLPNHSFLFGDLITLGKVLANYPSDIAGHTVFQALVWAYPEVTSPGLIYIDFWPISWPSLIVFNPSLNAQFTQETSLPKHEILQYEFQCFSQCKDLVTTDGPYWKKWRSIYNSGFSAQNIQKLVPEFVEEAQIFKKYLEGVAQSGEKIQLENQAMAATCDIISRAVLGKSLNIQTSDAPIYAALKKNVSWLYSTWAPVYWNRMFHPLRKLSIWQNNRIIYKELKAMIEDQLQNYDRVEGPKTINSLAIRAYMKEVGGKASPDGAIDPEFLETTIEQIKIFLFAGHDTTSSTLCFIYNRLHNNPDVLAQLRAEHDAVFGPDPSTTASQIAATPTLLNQLSYTAAVIKETLRLDAVLSSVRQGQPGFFLTHPETRQVYPTDGFMVLSNTYVMHRHPDYWPEPNAFRPERWLVSEGDPLRPVKDAWRPFELGPRACIGQELVLTELRMILAMTMRDLEIVPAYDEGSESFNGDVAYQVDAPGELVPHPKDGMPVRIRKRDHVPA